MYNDLACYAAQHASSQTCRGHRSHSLFQRHWPYLPNMRHRIHSHAPQGSILLNRMSTKGISPTTSERNNNLPNLQGKRKNLTMTKRLRQTDITYKKPGNGLPSWIKEQAETRGYADALEPLSLIVTEADIDAAFDCKAHGDGSGCVMAQAGQRIGARTVYFYRTTAWVDTGKGPILRFETSRNVYKNIIDPFDKGDREATTPGHYNLTPPKDNRSLKRRREYSKTQRRNKQINPKKIIHSHTDRVVMAAQT